MSDTFLDSAWYYLRYLSPQNDEAPFDRSRIKRWCPVDMYIGGAEHSVLHLLYVRFLALAFHDVKVLKFGKSDAPKGEPFPTFRTHGLLIREGAKMSKSKGNVVSPDETIEKFGADALRMYLMFLAPLEQDGDFRDAGISGITRFLERVWKFYAEPGESSADSELQKLLHQTIKKVFVDIERLHHNTAISALMILLNAMEKSSFCSEDVGEGFLKLLAPFAPHITEEIWRETLGHGGSIHLEKWPEHDPARIREDTFTLVVQINGKVRDSFNIPTGTAKVEAYDLALGRERVKKFVAGKKPDLDKVIYVQDRIINIVI